MNASRRLRFLGALFLLCVCNVAAQPLPSWNEGPARASILAFVQAVTDKSGRDYVEPAHRIAVFDNDGTLWSEQPIYFQLEFVLGQVKAAAPRHPGWKDDPVFKALMDRRQRQERLEHSLCRLKQSPSGYEVGLEEDLCLRTLTR